MKISELFETDYKPNYIDIDQDSGDDHHQRLLNYGNKLVEFIKQNCNEWLKQSNNGSDTVYRGMKTVIDRSKIAFVKDTRTDRRPRDSSIDQHAMFIEIIKDAGLKANRDNSIFVTGNASEALSYSRSDFDDIFVVLPIGQFNYTWNTKVSDWTDAITSNIDKNETIEKLENNLMGDDGSLHQAIVSGNEIMIYCNSAIYINYMFYRNYVKKLLNNEEPWDEAWKSLPSEFLN